MSNEVLAFIASQLRAIASRLLSIEPEATSSRIVEWTTKLEPMPQGTAAAGWRARIETGPSGFVPMQQDVAESARSASFTLTLSGNYTASVQRLNSASAPIGAKGNASFSVEGGPVMVDIQVPDVVTVRSGDTPPPPQNQAPVWTTAPVNPNLYPGQSYDLKQSVTDPDGDPLTFYPEGGEAALAGKATLSPDGILTATSQTGGPVTIPIVADDGRT